MTSTVLDHIGHPVGHARLRHYLMCPPTYFDVTYSINPWMDPTRSVDRVLALRQWSDAFAFGLNAVSDGRHVFIPSGARQLREELAANGYTPIPVDLSGLIKGGGSVKCCTQGIRPAPSRQVSDISSQRPVGAAS